MPSDPLLPEELWDDEAREQAWQNIQQHLREGETEGAALLLQKLNQHGGKPGTAAAASVEIEEGPAPYDPLDLYENLAYHYKWSFADMRAMDYRTLHGFVWRLQRRLEEEHRQAAPKEHLPETPEELEMEVVGLARQGWRPTQPAPYSGAVVPVS